MSCSFKSACLLVALSLSSPALPQTATQPKERYIPVELWAGAQWDGKPELKMPKVDASYRHRDNYRIKGPIAYKHPVTGEAFQVYERLYYERQGVKRQLFTINTEQTGLGRLYDGRPGQDTRTSSGGLKFPIGLWKEGETRRYVYKVWDTKEKESERVESLTITQIDFNFQGMQHCLEFSWLLTNGEGTKRYDQHTYTYCPGKSMVGEVHY